MKFDEKAVLMAMKNDNEAFASIYRSICTDLYKMAFYIMGNGTLAEDIVSDTVLDAYKGISKLKDSSKFEQWILKILTNKCKKMLRSKYSRFSVFNPDARNIDDYNLKSENDLSAQDERTDIQNAISKLPQLDRMIISLCIVEGYKSHEAAQILSMNPSTVRSRLNRSLAKIKNDLEVK
ncbi:MAG: RNA polymerase sigma factor [Eubacterium sp.]